MNAAPNHRLAESQIAGLTPIWLRTAVRPWAFGVRGLVTAFPHATKSADKSAHSKTTGDPLRLAAGHFGLGHGGGAHGPGEYYVIESSNPKVQGIDGATR